jgi:hypothetical protein
MSLLFSLSGCLSVCVPPLIASEIRLYFMRLTSPALFWWGLGDSSIIVAKNLHK